MMDLAAHKVKEGSLLDAAEIARYVMILTCAEYEADHPYGEQYGQISQMWKHISIWSGKCMTTW